MDAFAIVKMKTNLLRTSLNLKYGGTKLKGAPSAMILLSLPNTLRGMRKKRSVIMWLSTSEKKLVFKGSMARNLSSDYT